MADAAVSSLADARARVADGVLDLRSMSPAPAEPDRCPWPGLASYAQDDGPWFAGRERLVAELAARLAGACLPVRGRGVGQRQVLGRSRGPPRRSRRRPAARQRGLVPAVDASGQPSCRRARAPGLLGAPPSRRRRDPRAAGPRRPGAGHRPDRAAGRPAGGGVDSVPRRGRASRVPGCARRADRRPGIADRAGAGRPRRLPRPAGRPSRTRRPPPPTTPCSWAPRRPTTCAAPWSPRRAGGSRARRRTGSTRWSPTPASEPGLLPLLSTSLRRLWERRDGRSAHAGVVRRHRWTAWRDRCTSRSRSTPASTTESRATRERCCCGWPARAKATPSPAAGCGVTSWRACRRDAGAGGRAPRGRSPADRFRRPRRGRPRGVVPGVAAAAGWLEEDRGRSRGPPPARRGRRRSGALRARTPPCSGAAPGSRPGCELAGARPIRPRRARPSWTPVASAVEGATRERRAEGGSAEPRLRALLAAASSSCWSPVSPDRRPPFT